MNKSTSGKVFVAFLLLDSEIYFVVSVPCLRLIIEIDGFFLSVPAGSKLTLSDSLELSSLFLDLRILFSSFVNSFI